ncbi:MAG: SusC/RagA family TonB-linked outer membrane protein [Bacteroidales bacterium]|nr:SusC/RagA family TonB-linked outer membrane protein [Bacteroidales bacterium]
MKKLKLSLVLALCCLATTLSAQDAAYKDAAGTASAPDPLDEPIDIGYGTQRQETITGATVKVKGEDLTKLSTVSAFTALQGQTPGALIIQNSGQPGAGFKVNVRGIGTFFDAEPLYVIDGVTGGDVNALNPADIESIEILKDAASTGIYGGLGGNGVVIVNTKKGKEGRTKVSYDGFYGWQNLARTPDVVDGRQYMQLYDMMLLNEGLEPVKWAEVLPANLYVGLMSGDWKGTNWLQEAYRKGAPTTSHSVNVSGGPAGHTYSVGFSYTGQDGILESVRDRGIAYERYTLRVNTDNVAIKVRDLDLLTIGQTLNLNFSKNHGIANGDRSWNSVRDYLRTSPLLPVYDRNGSYYDLTSMIDDGYLFDTFSPSTVNTIALDNLSARGLNDSKNMGLQGSVHLQLQPIKGLKLKTKLGLLLSAGSTGWEEKEYTLNQSIFNNVASSGASTAVRQKISWENTLSYDCTIASNHHISALVGHSLESWSLAEAFSGPALSRGALSSIFARLGYNYGDRYILNAAFRADGISYFPKGKRWAYFPSVSAAWVISNEPWMKNVKKYVSLLKIRGSWGQNGNAYATGTGTSVAYMDFYGFGNKILPEQAAYIRGFDNPDLKWETTRQVNVGLDMRFLDSRLGLSIDGYRKTSIDCIIPAAVPSIYGNLEGYINGGSISNEGIELAIDWGKYTGDFQYGIKLNGAFNRNKVIRIDNTESVIHGRSDILSEGTSEIYRIEMGRPIGVFYGYKTLGVFQNQEQIDNYTGGKFEDSVPGDLIFADINGDGAITSEDRTVIGDPHPDFTAGLNLWFAYKGLDLNISGYGAFGQQIIKSYRSFTTCYKDNFSTDMLNTWQGEGTSDRLPRLTYGSDRNWRLISDIYVQDGDYFRISNITLGYDFKQLIRNAALSKLRLYASVQNPFTITKYQGMDPEVGYGAGESWMQGIDLGSYPSPRTFLVGINLSF